MIARMPPRPVVDRTEKRRVSPALRAADLMARRVLALSESAHDFVDLLGAAC